MGRMGRLERQRMHQDLRRVTSLRKRSYKVLAENGGRKCGSRFQETMHCNTQPCPRNCDVGPWEAWGAWSASCDTATRVRTRPVIVTATLGARACPALSKTQT